MFASLIAVSLLAPVTFGLLGDVDGDGSVTFADADRVLEAVIGMTTLTPQQEEDADVDGTGAVDVKDALMIQQFAAGSLAEFPPRLPQNSAPIALSRNGDLLGVVNPDSNSVTFIDPADDSVLIELSVGRDPQSIAFSRDGRKAYVTNGRDATVSIVDTSSWTVNGTIAVGVEPFGVAVNFRGDRAYVANFASGTVSVIDTASDLVIETLDVAPKPQQIGITRDSARLFVTHLNGREVSIVETATSVVTNLALSEIPFDPPNPTQPAGNFNRMKGIALHPTQDRAWLPAILSNNENFVEALFNTSIFPVVGVLDTIAGSEVVPERMTLFSGFSTVVSSPEAAAFSPSGDRVYVVCSASNDLVVMNFATQQEVGLIRDVGDNPRGIVVSADGTKAYLFNRLTPEISVVDLASETLSATIPVSTDPLPPNLANGRRLLFTSALPEVAGDRFFGCEACHFDGREDGRTWFFTNGPRQTQTMEGGTLETGLLHHTGDRANVQDFGSAFTRLQNGTGLTDDQLDDLADYVNFGIRRLENPFLNPDGSHTAAARRGRRLFRDAVTQCSSCHSGAFFTDAQGFTDPSNPRLHDVGTFAEGNGVVDPTDKTRDQDGIAGGTIRPAGSFESGFLLGIWATGPWLHDGSADTLLDTLTTQNVGDAHGTTSHLTAQQRADLTRYMEELHLSTTRVQIDRPADAARVVDLTVIEGDALPDVTTVDLFVDGMGPIPATVSAGRFSATVPPGMVPAVPDGSLFDITAIATTDSGEPGRDDVEAEVNYGGSVDLATSTVEASPGVIAADGNSFAKILVSPRDGSSRLVGTGLSIELSTTSGTLGPVVDAGDGTYTASLTSEVTAGSATVSAKVAGGSPFVDTAIVAFAAGDVDPLASTLAATPLSLEADGVSTAAVTVTPRDAFGNTLGAGQTVLLSVDLGSLSGTVDRGDGTYSATYTSGMSTGSATLSATVNGTPLNATPTITLLADTTAPAAPDLGRITFGTPSGGISQVIGGQLAAEPLATVQIENTTTATIASASAGGDGSFVTSLAITSNDQLCLRLEDPAGNIGPTVCEVPFPVSVFAVSGKLQQAVAGGGFSPLGGEQVQLFAGDLSTPASPSFSPLFIDNSYLTDTTQSDGRFQILLPTGFVPDPDLAVVWGTDDDSDGSIDTILQHALVNDIGRSVVVDELSSSVILLIGLNESLLGTDPCAPDFTGPCPVDYFTPDERSSIDATLREATSEIDFTQSTPTQSIADDVFFDVDGPKDALDQIAFNTFVAAATTPGLGGPPVLLSGTATVPGPSGDLPLANVTVQLGTLSIAPINVSLLSGATATTDASGNFTVQLPSFVAPGPSLVAVAAGDLTYDGAGNPGPFTATSDLSIAGFVLNTTDPVETDLAERLAMSLIEFGSAPLENFSPEELTQLTDLVRVKLATSPPILANRTLAQVFSDTFNALAFDFDILNLVLAIADPESGAGNSLVTASPTSLEADGFSRSVITVEPLDANSERVGPGLFVTLSTTLGSVTSPAIDNRDGTYTGFLIAPTTPGTATVSATVEGIALAQQPDITITTDLTAPAAPDAQRLLITAVSASTATVAGLPGAVEPRCELSIDNLTQGGSVAVIASDDGSFRADLVASSGDALTLRCTDAAGNVGPDTPLTVSSADLLPLLANPTDAPGGATLSLLDPAQLPLTVPNDYLLLQAFQLDLAGQASTAPLELIVESATSVPPGQQLLLAQIVELQGQPQLRVVAPARADGGVLSPLTAPEYPGARDEGTYLYLAATAPVAFVHGVVDGDRGTIQGVRLALDTAPFVDLTRSDGSYLLAGPANSATEVQAQLFTHETAATEGLFVPFGASLSSCDFTLSTRADRAFGFTGRFASVGQIADRIEPIPSGGQLYVGLGASGDIAIVDTAAMQQTSFSEDAQPVNDLAFTPNGFEAFIAYLTRVRDFTLSIEEPGLLIRQLDFPKAVAITPDGDEAVVVSSVDNAQGDATPDRLFLIDTFSNFTTGAALSIPPDPLDIAINRAGDRAYVLGLTALTVVDLSGPSVLASVALGSQPTALALSPIGDRLFVADGIDDEVRVLDATLAEDAVADNETLAVLPVGLAPSSLAISPDGATLLVAEQNADTISVFDTASLTLSSVWAVRDLPTGLAIHADGRHGYVLDPLLGQGVLEIPLKPTDTKNPEVIDVGPEDRVGAVLQDSPVEAVFSEAMDLASFDPAHVVVRDAQNQPIPGSLSAAGDGVTVVFTPDPSVRYVLNSTLTVELGTGLTDASGRPLLAPVQRIVPTFSMQLPNPALISADLTTDGVQVTGVAGAVEPESEIVVTNQTSGEEFRTVATSDGSFLMTVVGLDTDGFELISQRFSGRARTNPIPVPINFSIVIPDPAKISYQAGPAGTLLAIGAPGAVDAKSSLVLIRNLTTEQQFSTTTINPDGSFTLGIFASSGDQLDLVSELLGAVTLLPVALSVPDLPVPILDFLSPDSFIAGDPVTLGIVGKNFGSVPGDILLTVGGAVQTGFAVDAVDGSPGQQAILISLPGGTPSGQVQLSVRGQTSNVLGYFAVTPPNTSTFVEEVVDSTALGDANAMLGSADQNYADLGPGGSITVRLGSTVNDGAGNDFQIFEDQSDGADCYDVQVSAAADGPFTSLGEYCGTTFVNLAGHPPIRFVRIVDADDGAPAAKIDAIFTIRVRMSISLLTVDDQGAVTGLVSGPPPVLDAESQPIFSMNVDLKGTTSLSAEDGDSLAIEPGAHTTLSYPEMVFLEAGTELQLQLDDAGANACVELLGGRRAVGPFMQIGMACGDGRIVLPGDVDFRFLRLVAPGSRSPVRIDSMRIPGAPRGQVLEQVDKEEMEKITQRSVSITLSPASSEICVEETESLTASVSPPPRSAAYYGSGCNDRYSWSNGGAGSVGTGGSCASSCTGRSCTLCGGTSGGRASVTATVTRTGNCISGNGSSTSAPANIDIVKVEITDQDPEIAELCPNCDMDFTATVTPGGRTLNWDLTDSTGAAMLSSSSGTMTTLAIGMSPTRGSANVKVTDSALSSCMDERSVRVFVPPPDARISGGLFDNLTPTERSFVYSNPWCAIKMSNINESGHREMRNRICGSPTTNCPDAADPNRGNAFLHAYVNCEFARSCSVAQAEEFWNAHEEYNGNDCAFSAMDFHNNEVGRSLSSMTGTCSDLVLNALNNGQLRYRLPMPTNPCPVYAP